MTRNLTRILWIVLLVSACAQAPAGTVPPANRDAVNVSGTGIMSSAPFELVGDYSVAWTAKADGNCYHGTSLRSTDGKRAADLISTSVDGAGSGTVYVYGLAPGRYYVEANSGCDWTFRFDPT